MIKPSFTEFIISGDFGEVNLAELLDQYAKEQSESKVFQALKSHIHFRRDQMFQQFNDPEVPPSSYMGGKMAMLDELIGYLDKNERCFVDGKRIVGWEGKVDSIEVDGADDSMPTNFFPPSSKKK